MRYFFYGVMTCLVLAAGCDKPDEVYKKLPGDWDPDFGNGFATAINQFYEGEKGFTDETAAAAADSGVVTVEVCTDEQVAKSVEKMVNEPIIPMQGAGGLDMRGGDDWAGLTIDQAQSPDMLCQATPYMDDGSMGYSYWGDQGEFFAIWNSTTRQIEYLLAQSGYKGTVEAEGWVFEINEPITKDGAVLDKADGTNLDPQTEENLREMNKSLVRQFRPSLNADDLDCVAAGSCYVVASGTVNVMWFMNVGLVAMLEPSEQRIVAIQLFLKRPFRIATGEATVEGSELTIKGTSSAGIPNCEVKYGTDWSHIEANCLGDDKMEMMEVTATYGYEFVVAQMGGVLVYFKRSGLAADENLDPFPTLQAGDKVVLVSINSQWEGNFEMPYSPVLHLFKKNLEEDIRADLNLASSEKTGVEQLLTPDDPDLPTDVAAKYKDQLRPGGVYAAFCVDTNESNMDAGVDGGSSGDPVYACAEDSAGKYFLPLIGTLKGTVVETLGTRAAKKHNDAAYYVQHLERAVGEYYNGRHLDDEARLLDDQITFRMTSANTVYATISIKKDNQRYTFNVYYTGLDDRMHFMNFLKGGTRQEDVLYHDARNNARGVFTFRDLRLSSGAFKLGQIDTIKVLDHKQDIRSAFLEVNWLDEFGNQLDDPMQVLAPYQEASSITGYWIPLPGFHDIFTPADWFSLSGGTIGAGFYMLPVPTDVSQTQREIVAITSASFFGEVPFCDQLVGLGDSVDEILGQAADDGYPCEMVIRHSENYEFITSVTDVTNLMTLEVSDNMVSQVVSWLR